MRDLTAIFMIAIMIFGGFVVWKSAQRDNECRETCDPLNSRIISGHCMCRTVAPYGWRSPTLTNDTGTIDERP